MTYRNQKRHLFIFILRGSARSQSVGPGVAENESPKRQIRSASQAPSSRKKVPTTSAGTERKPRPCK